LINSGYVADITDLLKERGWLDIMNPSIRELLSENGRTYGIPGGGNALGLMLNTALFQEAGLVDEEGLPLYPKTWAELAVTGKKIKAATGTAGCCLLAQDNAAGWQFSNIAWAFGAELAVKNADGSMDSNLDSPEAIAAMEYVKALKWDYDILTEDPTVENFSTGFTQLGSGQAAMFIGASDSVELVTSVNGLPAEKLSLVPLPAGPGGAQYSMFDGIPYMFSKAATKEQINAALDYINLMGKGPVPNKDAYEADCSFRKENGIPVIYRFPNWTGQNGMDLETALINTYSNTDLRLYQDYYDILKLKGNLRVDSLGDMLYLELTPVIQTVIQDKNADVTALMKTADENYQKVLDQNFPN
jgi:ABC-type glycerol-3-phosphate transport system substrate-binding protein